MSRRRKARPCSLPCGPSPSATIEYDSNALRIASIGSTGVADRLEEFCANTLMAVAHSMRTATKTPSPRRIAICEVYHTLLRGARAASPGSECPASPVARD